MRSLDEDRDRVEKDVAAALLSGRRSRRGELLRALSQHRSAAAIPKVFWNGWAESNRGRISDLYAGMHRTVWLDSIEHLQGPALTESLQESLFGDWLWRSIARALGQLGRRFTDDREARDRIEEILEERSRQAGDSRGRTTAEDYPQSVRRRLIKKVDDNLIELNRLPDDLAAERVTIAVDDALGKNLADLIAITRTTEVVSTARRSASQDAGAATGVPVVDIWSTERDEFVCPICFPLHRQPSRIWEPAFPLGPPAHLRCRCDLLPVWSDVTALLFLPDGPNASFA